MLAPSAAAASSADVEEAKFTPNHMLVDQLSRNPSAIHELPDGRPARMPRPEAVAAINEIMTGLFPGVDLAAINGGHLDERELGRYERGEVHWPSKYRRAALRAFLDAQSDQDLGFFRSLALQPVLADDRKTGKSTVDRGADVAAAGMPPVSHPRRSSTVNGSTAHPARVYDYWLGGKDNFAADREFADAITRRFAWVPKAARANRDFRVRAVRAVAEAGVRQFLDVGTGLPSPGNTHEVAQELAPDARVLYVDNDPLVMVHSRALMVGKPEGRTAYIEADVRQTGVILGDPVFAQTLDPKQPVCLMLAAVLHFIPDLTEAQRAVRTLVEAVAPGSYLVISHGTPDFVTAQEAAEYERMYASGETVARTRTKADIESFFTGLEVLEPGFVAVSDWRPTDDSGGRPTPHDVSLYGVVARVP
ncbi:SAM-dependent methyltransferase [Actinoplanes sp. NPDC026619]|uniref:SAM-dependent methyltransferase n=1 Tax=Actinoplanes sp. NPDC026619 TaxID=3155798 RepID=UPI0033C89A77